MKCFLKGAGAFVMCALPVALFLPSIHAGGAYRPKEVPVLVRVIDSSDSPVNGAEVLFSQASTRGVSEATVADIQNKSANVSSGITDENGQVTIRGRFRARDNRRGSPLERKKAWYFPSGEWVSVVTPDGRRAQVRLSNFGFSSEREYDNDIPLEVLVVIN